MDEDNGWGYRHASELQRKAIAQQIVEDVSASAKPQFIAVLEHLLAQRISAAAMMAFELTLHRWSKSVDTAKKTQLVTLALVFSVGVDMKSVRIAPCASDDGQLDLTDEPVAGSIANVHTQASKRIWHGKVVAISDSTRSTF